MKLACLLVCAACGGTDIAPGVYEVTEAYAQDTGSALPNVVGTQITIMRTANGIVVDDAAYGVSEIPANGDDYGYEKYSVARYDCEAGGNKHCSYSYIAETVSVPTSGTIRLTKCAYHEDGSCSSPSPTCSTAEEVLGESVPCRPPQTTTATRIGDIVPVDAL